MLGDLFVVPLTTYLGYTGTLRLSWDLWSLLWVDIRNLRGNLRAFANYTLPQFGGYTGVGDPNGCSPCWTF
jgi:hypothetical protein